MRIGTLRRLIRETLGASASGTSPGDAKGFYSYDMERGVDIHGYWYRSPGRAMGGDGDPFRPADAAQFIGMKPPPDDPVNTPGVDAADDVESSPDVASAVDDVEVEPSPENL